MIIENEDTFEIETGSLVVGACRSDASSLQLELASPVKTWTLTIEGSFSLKDDDGNERAVAEAGQARELVGKPVRSLRARKLDGQLDLGLGRDWVLTVYPDHEYEAWEMHSTQDERLIAVPGNGIAVWQAKT